MQKIRGGWESPGYMAGEYTRLFSRFPGHLLITNAGHGLLGSMHPSFETSHSYVVLIMTNLMAGGKGTDAK